jgi:hypothetical protein
LELIILKEKIIFNGIIVFFKIASCPSSIHLLELGLFFFEREERKMSVKVLFNDELYDVDFSRLEESSNELKSYLSIDMKGTGAEVKFSNETYPVDDAKLAAAGNLFLSYLDSLSGTDRKVIISGVEYGIDSAKVANAVADLGVVFKGLDNG